MDDCWKLQVSQVYGIAHLTHITGGPTAASTWTLTHASILIRTSADQSCRHVFAGSTEAENYEDIFWYEFSSLYAETLTGIYLVQGFKHRPLVEV